MNRIILLLILVLSVPAVEMDSPSNPFPVTQDGKFYKWIISIFFLFEENWVHNNKEFANFFGLPIGNSHYLLAIQK